MATSEQVKYLLAQIEKINSERAIAVKALQEIELYLSNSEPTPKAVLSYGTAVAALVDIGEWEEPNV